LFFEATALLQQIPEDIGILHCAAKKKLEKMSKIIRICRIALCISREKEGRNPFLNDFSLL
jgi:hypothetical protein